jgi:hypothetical protein
MWTHDFSRNARSLTIISIFMATHMLGIALALTLSSHWTLPQAYSMTLYNIGVKQKPSGLLIDFQTRPQVVEVGKTFIVIANITNVSANTITFTIKCSSLSSTTLDTNPKLRKVQEFARSGPIRYVSLNPREQLMLIDPCSSKYTAISEGNIVGKATLVLYDESGISPKYPPLSKEFHFIIEPQP